MDFAFTDEQTMLRDSARRFVEQDYGFEQRRAVIEGQGGFAERHWAHFANLGWLGAALPEDAGGFGGDAVATALIAEQLGRGLVVEPYAAVAVLAAQALLHAGGARAEALLGALIEGRARVVVALDALHRPFALGRGRAVLLAGGPLATHFLLPVRSESGGVSLFLLQRDTPGLVRHDYRLIDGSAACDLLFDSVALDTSTQVGAAGGAAAALDLALAHARAALCAEAVGVMDRALWTTRDYLQQRSQFGVPLASFQALQHRLADMLIAHEQARAAQHGALAALVQDDAAVRRRAVAIAKVQAGRSGRFVGAQAIQLHGGIGVTDECIVGHCFKRLMVLDSLLGNSQFHLGELAGPLQERA